MSGWTLGPAHRDFGKPMDEQVRQGQRWYLCQRCRKHVYVSDFAPKARFCSLACADAAQGAAS